MQLLPIDTPQLVEVVAGWMGDKRNYQWLDFGNGVQMLDRATLRIMTQKQIHVLRAYTADDDVTPIGIVGLSNVDRLFKTATIWVLLGDKTMSSKGYPLRASARMLTLGFRDLGLRAIDAWAVECNHASIRIIKRLNFRCIGMQRRSHCIDGRVYGRLLFDILPEEHADTEVEG